MARQIRLSKWKDIFYKRRIGTSVGQWVGPPLNFGRSGEKIGQQTSSV